MWRQLGLAAASRRHGRLGRTFTQRLAVLRPKLAGQEVQAPLASHVRQLEGQCAAAAATCAVVRVVRFGCVCGGGGMGRTLARALPHAAALRTPLGADALPAAPSDCGHLKR